MSTTKIVVTSKRKYSFSNFLFDVFMCIITSGLWFIWIFCREMRNR